MDKPVIDLPENTPIRITALDRGMVSGLPSVAIRLDLPDGTVVVAQTSLRLFRTANNALEGWRQRVGAPE